MVLWCLLTGREHAWMDAAGRIPGIGSLVTRVLRGQRPECDVSTLRDDAPSLAVALMQRAWAQDPAARPTAMEVVEVFAGLLMRPGP